MAAHTLRQAEKRANDDSGVYQGLHLVRHGEARKNLADRHGGPGSALTSHGRKQALAAARYLGVAEGLGHDTLIVGHRVPQVVGTAEIIQRETQWDYVTDERLRGISLGVLAGLSRTEAARKYPGPSRRLEEWRNGRRRIDELDLPGGEPVEHFRSRIHAALTELESQRRTNLVIVGTNSTLIMLYNTRQLGTDFEYGLYQPYTFPNGSVTSWPSGYHAPPPLTPSVDRFVPNEWP